MRAPESDLVSPRVWLATGLLAALVIAGIVLLVLFGDQLTPLLATATTAPSVGP